MNENQSRVRLEGLLNRTTSTLEQQHPRNDEIRSEIEQLGQMRGVSRVLSTAAGSQIEQTLRNIIQNRVRPAATATTRPPTVAQRQQPETATTATTTPVISIEQLTREQIVSDMDTLVHRQLVSSTLRSEFRTALEERILTHMRHLGVENGAETRQMVLNLGRNRQTIPRNDFSHLGISTTNTRETPRSSASANARELRDLKSEMAELKSMLKLSFDVQLDMQRALRQEIASLVAGTWSRESADLAASTRVTRDAGSCVICTETSVDTVLYECGHMCACYGCARKLMQEALNCPVCRAPIKDVVRAYRVGLE